MTRTVILPILAFAGVASYSMMDAFAPSLALAQSGKQTQEEKIDFDQARQLFQKKQQGGTLTADEEAYIRKAQAARQAQNAAQSAGAAQGEKIDFDRARQLFQKKQQGGTLTADEEAFLQKAQAARRAMGNANPGGNPGGPPPTPRETTGLKPLTEMTASDRYKDEDGGLYGRGRNVPPPEHQTAAEAELSRIQPLNANGEPDPNGRIVFVSISMSNATQEFSRFKQIADADPDKSSKLTIVDCAQGGQAMAQWAPPDARPWMVAEERLTAQNVSPRQVQIAWFKLANVGPRGELQEHGRRLQRDTQTVIQNAKNRFPNLRIAYLSSRIYGGYATTNLNPEPYAYESAFAARWLIQDQIKGEPALNYSPAKGDVKAPLLLWGPYLWADGTKPRSADKLSYSREDLVQDGTHPSDSGRTKVARVMLEFYKTDPLAKTWFLR